LTSSHKEKLVFVVIVIPEAMMARTPICCHHFYNVNTSKFIISFLPPEYQKILFAEKKSDEGEKGDGVDENARGHKHTHISSICIEREETFEFTSDIGGGGMIRFNHFSLIC
jgi:hypothetical protein